ncbi:hypothetical protein CRG98_018326 [Punica granatum]|uniref:Uncharacterized protein n=1 Tax=Punica granatum TaxID=22663 RepID=A0A2I0JYC4_PUNGR|nr:hypothetical protein CRG98_018326 [Punica granatum]
MGQGALNPTLTGVTERSFDLTWVEYGKRENRAKRETIKIGEKEPSKGPSKSKGALGLLHEEAAERPPWTASGRDKFP